MVEEFLRVSCFQWKDPNAHVRIALLVAGDRTVVLHGPSVQGIKLKQKGLPVDSGHRCKATH